MKKRQFIQNSLRWSLVTSALGSLPAQTATAEAEAATTDKPAKASVPPISQPTGYLRQPFGEWQLYLLSDGQLNWPDVPHFCLNAPPQEVQRLLQEDFRSTEQIDLAMNILLVKTKDRLVLFDSGLGSQPGAPTGQLPQSLALANIAPSDLTDIVITHAHGDHIGGLLNDQGRPRYPQARHHITKIEHDFWLQATAADFAQSGFASQPELLQGFIDQARKILNALADQLEFIDLDQPLIEGISFQLAPGHTPGMVVTTLQSGSEQLVHLADLIHHDALQFPHPDWAFAGDTDPQLAAETRRKLLSDLSQRRLLTNGYHLPWPGLGHIRAENDHYQWVAQTRSTLSA